MANPELLRSTATTEARPPAANACNPPTLTAAHRHAAVRYRVEVINQANGKQGDGAHQRPWSVRARPGDRSDAGGRQRAGIFRSDAASPSVEYVAARGCDRGSACDSSRGRTGTSTGVQPGRPLSTQSWFLRMCAMTSAIQMPTAISSDRHRQRQAVHHHAVAIVVRLVRRRSYCSRSATGGGGGALRANREPRRRNGSTRPSGSLGGTWVTALLVDCPLH